MKLAPRPYQRLMADFIIDTPRCNLWVPMGLGKTSATLTALNILWLAGSKFHPALVIAPKRVAESVWSAEIRKWEQFHGLKCSVLVGSKADREAALRRKADIYTINYDNLVWLVEECGKDWPFQIVIADESTKLKGFRLRHGGKRAAALSKVARLTGRWVNLTGTPSPNGLIDLWGQNWFVDFGHRLGRTFTAFKERWFIENVYERTIEPKPTALPEISERLADVTFCLNANDWFDLQEPISLPVEVELPPAARKLYDEMERELFIELAGDLSIEAMSGASRSNKCLQIACGAVFDNEEEKSWHEVHDAKLEALRDIVEESAGAPLLVAYNFTFDRERILKAFPGARVLTYDHDIEDWNAGKIAMLLVHPASAGHGLNLQDGGNRLVFYSQGWSLENQLQVIERIGPTRQMQSGYDRPVYVYSIVAADTIEQTVLLPAMFGKRATQDALMESRRTRV
jgi:hypothetical protein